jgi:hypothetical protein
MNEIISITIHLFNYIASDASAVGPSVNSPSTDFSFQKLVFWNLFEFSAA